MLLDTPEHLETLAARPELWPNAVEEILRLESPVQMSARIACKDADVAGTVVRRGEWCHLPRGRQPRPEGLRRSAPLRHRTRQRGQASVLLRRQALLPRCGAGPRRRGGRAAHVLRALPDARLAGAGSRRDTRVLRGWSSLPVRLEGRAPQYGCDVDFRAALLEETRAFGELIRTADPATPVPTCPDGRSGSCSATSAGETDGPRRSSPTGATKARPPRSTRRQAARRSRCRHRLAQRRRPAHPRLRRRRRRPHPVWTFIGPRPRDWWIRRRLHEATVHRADAAIALGRTTS